MKISFIGAGNVATHLSQALTNAGHQIVGVYTKSVVSAESLAQRYGGTAASCLEHLPESDLYIFSIKDDALSHVINDFGKLHRKGICIHTAGSVPIDVFKGKVENYGVLYPLQTFSRKRKIVFSDIPLFIEANHEDSLQVISRIAHDLSEQVYRLDSESRRKLHLAAVFACNFSNHCFAIAGSILSQAHLPEKLLRPLIMETCNKLATLPAIEGQTGPAVRYDEKVMAEQMKLLDGDLLRRDIYQIMSKSIHDYALSHIEKNK